jgi:L-asparagine transporter-like permease
VVGIVPWNQIDLRQSPFVRVFEITGIPAASHIMNFVVLTAVLSAATCVYFTSQFRPVAIRLAYSIQVILCYVFTCDRESLEVKSAESWEPPFSAET